MTTSQKLRELRIAKGLTMKEVADMVGVSEAAVSRWESGDIANMRRDRIAKLAKTLGVPPVVLLEDDYHEPQPSEHDKLVSEVAEQLSKLSQDQLKQVLNYARFISQSNPNR